MSLMNCYRCGFEFSGARCLICGKHAPGENDPVGIDSAELRIAVFFSDPGEGMSQVLEEFESKADYYHHSHLVDQPGHVFAFTPERSKELFELLQATEFRKNRTLLFNGRRRPYDAELWLPLLWFLTT